MIVLTMRKTACSAYFADDADFFLVKRGEE